MKLLTASQWSKLITSFIASYLAGFIGSIATNAHSLDWYASLIKPTFTPPSWVFGPVWIVLYACIGVVLYRLWISHTKESRTLLALFFVQLILNALWSVFFFGFANPIVAYIDIILLWIIVAVLTLDIWKIDKVAAIVLVPYWGWITFASFLNLGVMLLN